MIHPSDQPFRQHARHAGTLYCRTTPVVQRNVFQSMVVRIGLEEAVRKFPENLLANKEFMAVCRGLDEKRTARLRRVGKILDRTPERPLLHAPWLGEDCVKVARKVNG